MLKQALTLLCALFLLQTNAQTQPHKNKMELGVFFTPPGIAAGAMRRPLTYIPYVVYRNKLAGSYEIGASFNYRFSPKWFLNARISDYNAHLIQTNDIDYAIFDQEEEHLAYRTIDARCHTLSFRFDINYIVANADKFEISLLSGPLIRMPRVSYYTTTLRTSWDNIINEDRAKKTYPFYLRLGGFSGVNFSYHVSSRLNLDVALTFEYTRSILKRTFIAANPKKTKLKNHWQFAFYFPVTLHYSL